MRESSKNVRLYVETENSAKSLNNNFRILQIILFISLVQLVMCTSVGVIGYIMPLYLTGIFEASKTQVGLFLSIGVGVSTLLIQIPSGIAADKYGNTNMMLLSALLTPILFLFPLWLSQYTQLAVIYMVIFASYSIVWPSSIAFLIDAVPYSKRSFAIGARQTAVRLGFTIGPLIGGYLWHLYTLGQLEPTFAFYISALSSGLSIPVILLLKKMEVTDT